MQIANDFLKPGVHEFPDVRSCNVLDLNHGLAAKLSCLTEVILLAFTWAVKYAKSFRQRRSDLEYIKNEVPEEPLRSRHLHFMTEFLSGF
jgi:hypothetical protein